MKNVAVIGGGPAGLRAAEVLAAQNCAVTIYEQKPSVGRKFLVAGRGGLNLTHAESLPRFLSRYGAEQERWHDLLAGFSPSDLRAWADALGAETFVGTSGRVFPLAKQAAPLLRRWVQRLKESEVIFATRHRWTGWEPGSPIRLRFQRETETIQVEASAVVLALGGASWPQTGSDGNWTERFESIGLKLTPFQPANCGYEVAWPAAILAMEGQSLKNIEVRAGDVTVAGECIITRYGLEGGPIYRLGPILRHMEKPELCIDLKPMFSVEQLVAKLGVISGYVSIRSVQNRWKLNAAAAALLMASRPFDSAQAWAKRAKALPISLHQPRPLAEAISSAGGVAWAELDSGLMLRRFPGIFLAGEMIDWEAPTGGYLLQGCLATGTRAGQSAAWHT